LQSAGSCRFRGIAKAASGGYYGTFDPVMNGRRRRLPKIVIIGAGSAVFGLKMLRDIVLTPELGGSELVLVDVNEKALGAMAKMAERVANVRGFPMTVRATADREEGLKGADYVIISVARDKNRLWKLDFTVPMKHGISHPLGENGGLGGLFHTLRSAWLVMEIVKDVERIAPDAWVLNFTNPESRVCMAIARYSKVRAVGLCHGLLEQRRRLGEFLEIPVEEMKFLASGLNHFTWIHEMKRRSTGEDLYPLLRRKLVDAPADFLPLCRFLFETFGLFPSPSDNHCGEYVPYATEFTPPRDLARFAEGAWRADRMKRVARAGETGEGLDEVAPPMASGERAMPIIAALETGKKSIEAAVNILNRGSMPGLPDDAIVEIPATVERGEIRGRKMPPLPQGVVAMLKAQVRVQKMVVDAAMTGDKGLALQAALTDPAVPSAKAAKAAFDELFELEADFLPQFA